MLSIKARTLYNPLVVDPLQNPLKEPFKDPFTGTLL